MPIHPEWSVALDLGTDLGATESDALYLEQALSDSGVATVIYPWHPLDDPFTPLGGTRPYKVLVPVAAHDQARELVLDVLGGRLERSEVLLPTDDAWALRYYTSILALKLLQASRERGVVWQLLYQVWRAYLIVTLVAVAVFLGWGLINWLFLSG